MQEGGKIVASLDATIASHSPVRKWPRCTARLGSRSWRSSYTNGRCLIQCICIREKKGVESAGPVTSFRYTVYVYACNREYVCLHVKG